MVINLTTKCQRCNNVFSMLSAHWVEMLQKTFWSLQTPWITALSFLAHNCQKALKKHNIDRVNTYYQSQPFENHACRRQMSHIRAYFVIAFDRLPIAAFHSYFNHSFLKDDCFALIFKLILFAYRLEEVKDMLDFAQNISLSQVKQVLY